MKMPVVKQELLHTISEQYMKDGNMFLEAKCSEINDENPVLFLAMNRIANHVSKVYFDCEALGHVSLEILTAQLVVYEAIKQQMICDELNVDV